MGTAINPRDIEDGFLAFCWQSLAPEARARILAKSPKTLWLFGAGASHHYRLNAFDVPVPLASGFFRAYHHLPISQGFDSHVGPFNNFLQEYRGVTPETVGEFDENIEAFMTSVEDKLESIRETARGRRLRTEEYADAISYAMVFTNMNFIFANVLNEAQNGASMSLYRMLLQLCGPNDLFVTFNWDTLLDRALSDTGGWNPNTGYGLTFRAVLDGSWKDGFEGKVKFPTNWKLLKLHGSTNWLVPYMGVDFRKWEFQTYVAGTDDVFLYWHSSLPYATHKNRWRGGYVPTTYCYYPPNLPADRFSKDQLSAPQGKIFLKATYRFLSPFEESDPTGTIPSSPILITPVRQKKYDIYRSTIQSLWSQAVKGLEEASRIVIIGYATANYNGIGSIDIIAAARSALRAGVNPQPANIDELLNVNQADGSFNPVTPGHRFVFVHTKCNIAQKGRSVAYNLKGGKLNFEGTVAVTAEDLQRGNMTLPARQGATQFLLAQLTNGPKSSVELFAAASKAGHSEKTIRRAAGELGIKKAPKGFSQGWEWKLPVDSESAGSQPVLPLEVSGTQAS